MNPITKRERGTLIFVKYTTAPGRSSTNISRRRNDNSMKTTENARKYAVEQGIAEEEALKQGMKAKSREFTDNGAELYAEV